MREIASNSYTGEYELDRKALEITALASTRKACVPALMTQEREFLDVLDDAARYEFDGTGALRITAEDGRVLTAR